MMESQPNGLFIKIARVMGKVQAVSENETHGQGWKYAGDKAIYDAVRPYLAEEGLAIIPSIREISDDNGKLRVMFDIKLVCGETGEVLSSSWAAESFSKDDKGINKCATVAMKYFLKTTFLIATGDPNDDGDSNVAPKQGSQKSQQRPPERPAQPRTTPTPQQIRNAGNALESEQSAQGAQSAPANGNGHGSAGGLSDFWKVVRGQNVSPDAALARLGVDNIADWKDGYAAAIARIIEQPMLPGEVTDFLRRIAAKSRKPASEANSALRGVIVGNLNSAMGESARKRLGKETFKLDTFNNLDQKQAEAFNRWFELPTFEADALNCKSAEQKAEGR